MVQRGGHQSPATDESPTLNHRSVAGLIEDAASIAQAHNRTVYGSFCIAPAVQSGSKFVTADERLANSVAARLPVKWLGGI
jgi:predicted nucleic acid-binding protein